MSQSLTRRQAILLGLFVLMTLGLTLFGMVRIAGRQGLWGDHIEVTVNFPEVHDVSPGTPVRIRGVEAGQVIAVEYPEDDGSDEAGVTLRLRLDGKYAGRLHADATAQLQSTGLLGGKIVAVAPGKSTAGPLTEGRLKGVASPDPAQAAANIAATAEEARLLVHEIRTSNGTLAKILKDDDLYHELKGLAHDSRSMVKRADAAVSKVEGEVTNVQKFVTDGRDTLRSVKQGSDALGKLPIVRSYVEDATAVLVRPDCRREAMIYNTVDLFEPGTAILTATGRDHLQVPAQWLAGVSNSKAEVAVAALCDPNDPGQTSASAQELTRKQSEAVVEFLKAQGVHKIGWVARRKMTPIGLGFGPSPVPEKGSVPPSYLQVVLFTPQ